MNIRRAHRSSVKRSEFAIRDALTNSCVMCMSKNLTVFGETSGTLFNLPMVC